MRARGPRLLFFAAGACAAASLLACAGSGGPRKSTPSPPPPAPAKPAPREPGGDGRTRVFRCEDGFGFSARFEAEHVWLFLPDLTLDLPQVPAASGAQYQAGEALFWTKDDQALLDRGEEKHRNCREDHGRSEWDEAKQRGVDFRAVGHEPAWELEIWDGKRIAVVIDEGAVSHVLPAPRPHVHAAAGETTYLVRRGAHAYAIVIEDRSCRDPVSGEDFETTVTLGIDGDALRGCGRVLR